MLNMRRISCNFRSLWNLPQCATNLARNLEEFGPFFFYNAGLCVSLELSNRIQDSMVYLTNRFHVAVCLFSNIDHR